MADNPLYSETDYVRFTHGEPSKSPYSSPFFKDYARVLHSAAFRRLQGKMQLFPVGQHAIARTRLTHSLEVAEIAVRIVAWLNNNGKSDYLKTYPIDRDLVATAALAHDLGHPPFGHSGEEALNERMRRRAFEGNAQTLRILTVLEQRHDGRSIEAIINRELETTPEGSSSGLDLCYRTLASVVKYDRNADMLKDEHFRARVAKPHPEREICKGYYQEEAKTVEAIRQQLRVPADRTLRTLECQIMDIADDIAYSTYDLEDAMIVGLIKPFDVIACADSHAEGIAKRVSKAMVKAGYEGRVDEKDVLAVLMQVFSNILSYADPYEYAGNNIIQRVVFVARSYRENLEHARNQAFRRRFMETLIEGAVKAISFKLDETSPMLSVIRMDVTKQLEIECLKAFTFEVVTSSQANRIVHLRSNKIVKALWDEFEQDGEGSLLPDDIRPTFARLNYKDHVDVFRRDLIATLTDAEATELYQKLHP